MSSFSTETIYTIISQHWLLFLANIVNPDETAHHEQSHLDPQWLVLLDFTPNMLLGIQTPVDAIILVNVLYHAQIILAFHEQSHLDPQYLV